LKPAIIFLDFYMPDLTGMEVLKDLRNSQDLALTPVVFHSTKILEDTELKFFKENTIAIFSKQSLTLPDSAARIRELLDTLAAHAGLNK
jgi:CheY-like chemotaxis protein